MQTELHAARVALDDMIRVAETSKPGVETTDRVFKGRALVGRAAIRAVERAMEVAGGSAFRRETGLERIFRDVQAARYHPLADRPQALYAGRMALGLDVDG
jgi:acyl-CoA dehydrogenase